MRYLFVATLAVAWGVPAEAGLEFSIETRDFDYSPPRVEQSKILAEGISLKMESNDGQSGLPDTVIYRGDRREMMVVDHQRRSYMVIDKQFAANMMRQLQQMSGQMQGMIDSIPADQRAMIQQMTQNQPQTGGQFARPQIDVRRVGTRAQVYGYPCTLYSVSRDGRKVRDVWVTNWNNIQGSRNLTTTFESMSQFTEELLSAFPVQAQQQAPMQDNALATISKMGGFPVASREYRIDGTVASESALRGATYRQIGLTELQPPTGYQQEPMFGGMSAAGSSLRGQGRR
ncbi:MAG: DUF4412 domain-containing protein [Planctomycetota bacterium]